MFPTLSKREIIILQAFNLSSANAFNLDWSKVLSFGKELNSLLRYLSKRSNNTVLQHLLLSAYKMNILRMDDLELKCVI